MKHREFSEEDYRRYIDKYHVNVRTSRLLADLRVASNTLKAIRKDVVEKIDEAYKYKDDWFDKVAISRCEKINKMLQEYNDKYSSNYQELATFLHKFRETRKEIQLYSFHYDY